MTDDRLLREVQAALDATGISVSDAEMIRLDAATDLDGFKPFLARCRTLGAAHVLVARAAPPAPRHPHPIHSYGPPPF